MGKGTIGFTCSCFDLLHAGHILMLKDSKKQCDKLIVGLQTNPTLDRPEKNKPIQSYNLSQKVVPQGGFWAKYVISCESKVACKFLKKESQKALNHVLVD